VTLKVRRGECEGSDLISFMSGFLYSLYNVVIFVYNIVMIDTFAHCQNPETFCRLIS